MGENVWCRQCAKIQLASNAMCERCGTTLRPSAVREKRSVKVPIILLWLTACGVILLGATTNIFKASDTEASADSPKPDNVAIAVASGAQVIAYSIADRKQDHGTEWIYVVPTHWPNDQELTDLAFNLRAQYPSASFEIVDSPLSVPGVEAVYTGDTNDTDFVKKHEVAMINMFGEPPAAGLQWKVLSPTGRQIANLSKFMPTDPAVIEARAQRAMHAELAVFKCKQLANKPLAELSANDFAAIRDCKDQGHW
jgi:hypothetical protein